MVVEACGMYCSAVSYVVGSDHSITAAGSIWQGSQEWWPT
ncbi:MAG: hypothetical protein ACI88C_000476, partial [Acidimicrobiales bacterium]